MTCKNMHSIQSEPDLAGGFLSALLSAGNTSGWLSASRSLGRSRNAPFGVRFFSGQSAGETIFFYDLFLKIANIVKFSIVLYIFL